MRTVFKLLGAVVKLMERRLTAWQPAPATA